MIDEKELLFRWTHRDEFIFVCGRYMDKEDVKFSLEILKDLPYEYIRNYPDYLLFHKIIVYKNQDLEVAEATKRLINEIKIYMEEL